VTLPAEPAPFPPPLPDDFRAAVAAELAAHGLTVIDWEPTGVNVRPAAGGDPEYVGLGNLHRRAKAADPAEWPRMVREFLDHRAQLLGSRALPDDLNTIQDRLRPRLGRPHDRSDRSPPWGLPLPGTGLELNLVVDCPHGMVYVTEPMLARSRRKGEDLLDVALANLSRNTPPDYFERATDEWDIYVGHLGDGYDAARALLIEELMPESPAGFWVVIPCREEIAVWPVSFPALGRVHVLKQFAADSHREHAYPVSDEVFWVWRGTWYRFGIELDGEELVIDAPPPFGDALAELEGEG
jgi:hypothetical protein